MVTAGNGDYDIRRFNSLVPLTGFGAVLIGGRGAQRAWWDIFLDMAVEMEIKVRHFAAKKLKLSTKCLDLRIF